jgi:2-keto-4-pentenoate hydratase
MKRLTDAEICSAADLLVRARGGQVTLAGLPPELTPEHTADVQRIIDEVSASVDRPIMGWKTYVVYKPMQPPFHAPIYDLLPSGSEIPAGISPGRLIEPEVMFRADRDLPARDRPYAIDEIAGAVTAVAGFEVIGSRYRSDGELGEGSLYGAYADHIANGCIVVGDPIPGWRDVAFEDVPLRMTEGERELAAVVGCHPFDNPFLPVIVGINRLRRTSGVKAGQVIVTNSSTSFFPVQAGTVIRAVYERLGEVTATFGRG